MSRSKAKKTKTKAQPTTRFVAGCGRSCQAAGDLSEVAYTELAYPECPHCIHRVEPQGAIAFCVWRPATHVHPFASLASWNTES